jgi:hypothetical protein
MPIVQPSQTVAECLQNFLDHETQYIVVKHAADAEVLGVVCAALND